jgi:CRISPR/Cas system-associated protein Cas7 (RAMP superfamily)
MGEREFTQNVMVKAVGEAVQANVATEHRITTAGGRFHVRWDENGSASALGQ